MHSFAPFSNLKIFVKHAEIFADFLNRILQFFRDFPKIQHFSESFRKMLQNRNFPVQRYVCISSRGPLPPLDLELYPRATQNFSQSTLLEGDRALRGHSLLQKGILHMIS